MRLVVDACVLVSELLRARGRARLADERLELFLAEHTLSENRHEVPKRVDGFMRHRGLGPDAGRTLVDRCFEAVEAAVTVVPEVAYQPLEQEARWRIARDPRDWPIGCRGLDRGRRGVDRGWGLPRKWSGDMVHGNARHLVVSQA
jgi:PIN domain